MKYLAIAVIVGGVLLLAAAGCRTRQAAAPPQASAPAPTSAATPAGAGVMIGPDEAACPVLGTVMKREDMIPVQYKGKTYYLCCADCVPRFKANPEKYIADPAKPTREMHHE